MNRIVMGLAALLLATVPAAAENPADGFDTLPNVVFVYYDVRGSSAAEIKQSIDDTGPRDLNDFGKMTARTEWYVIFHWVNGPDGKCIPAQTTASFEALVILPRLVTPVSPELATRWKDFLFKLRLHEANHARYAYDHMPGLVAATRAAPTCEAASGVLAPAVEAIRKHDTDYDTATDHGRTEGIIWQ